MTLARIHVQRCRAARVSERSGLSDRDDGIGFAVKHQHRIDDPPGSRQR